MGELDFAESCTKAISVNELLLWGPQKAEKSGGVWDTEAGEEKEFVGPESQE